MQRAFQLADRDLRTELRTSLRKVAEPVRTDAERLAVAGIPTVGVPWSRMRTGVTQTSVYVAPRERGTRDSRRRRPKFASVLLNRAMLPALRRNEHLVAVEMDRLLAEVARDWERA